MNECDDMPMMRAAPTIAELMQACACISGALEVLVLCCDDTVAEEAIKVVAKMATEASHASQEIFKQEMNKQAIKYTDGHLELTAVTERFAESLGVKINKLNERINSHHETLEKLLKNVGGP